MSEIPKLSQLLCDCNQRSALSIGDSLVLKDNTLNFCFEGAEETVLGVPQNITFDLVLASGRFLLQPVRVSLIPIRPLIQFERFVEIGRRVPATGKVNEDFEEVTGVLLVPCQEKVLKDSEQQLPLSIGDSLSLVDNRVNVYFESSEDNLPGNPEQFRIALATKGTDEFIHKFNFFSFRSVALCYHNKP